MEENTQDDSLVPQLKGKLLTLQERYRPLDGKTLACKSNTVVKGKAELAVDSSIPKEQHDTPRKDRNKLQEVCTGLQNYDILKEHTHQLPKSKQHTPALQDCLLQGAKRCTYLPMLPTDGMSI